MLYFYQGTRRLSTLFCDVFFYGSAVLCFDIYTTVFEQFGNYKAGKTELA